MGGVTKSQGPQQGWASEVGQAGGLQGLGVEPLLP